MLHSGRRKALFLIGSLIIGFLILYGFGSFAIGIAFALIWFDKVIIGVFEPVRYVGVELTTAGTVLLALALGPVNAFLISLVIIPVLHAVKHIALPIGDPEWPLFLPSPYDAVNALGAAAAGLVAGLPLFWVIAITALAKVLFYAIADTQILRKPIDFMGGVTTVVFNVTAGWLVLAYFAGVAGL